MTPASPDRTKVLRQKHPAAWGVHLSFLCPELIECLGRLEFDWLFLDAQHTPLSPHLCRELVRAADVAGLTCAVRVPEIRAAEIEAFLDVGVSGIIAPCVSSAEAARALVAAVKFAPAGQRGAAANARTANYGLTESPAAYYRRANQTTFVVALIEDQAGIDALESIVTTPGIDYVGIGANDLGLSLGVPAGLGDPRVRELVDGARARIRACGKPQLSVVSDAGQAQSAVEQGARLIAVPDIALVANAGRTFLHGHARVLA